MWKRESIRLMVNLLVQEKSFVGKGSMEGCEGQMGDSQLTILTYILYKRIISSSCGCVTNFN